jgi:glycine oxidase
MQSIGIAGAGLLGRLLAWRLAQAGHRVQVFDLAAGPGPSWDGRQAAGFTAAGMLSPLAERDVCSERVSALGWRSVQAWPRIVAQLPGAPACTLRGSLLLAHRADHGAALRTLARVGKGAQPLSAAQLAELEPALQPLPHAWLLPGEGHIDTVNTLLALQAVAPGVAWHWGCTVTQAEPGRLTLADGTGACFDTVLDTRGLGARPALPLRGVRGELVHLNLPAHGLTRPVRLLHPRHRVYLVPRNADTLLLGASEIESEDRSPMSLRSAVELMSAAHSVMPAIAEARITRLDVNLRPALPDNDPCIERRDGLVRINGLFRHGWLLAPALVEDALEGFS